MRSLAIYALLASAATLVTAGPVNAQKAAEGPSDLDRLDQLIRSYQQGGNNRAQQPGGQQPGGQQPGGQQPGGQQPDGQQPGAGQPGADQPALLPIDGSNTTITQIVTPTVRKPGATQSPVPPVSQTSSGAALPVSSPQGTTSSIPNVPDRESTSVPITSSAPVIAPPPPAPAPPPPAPVPPPSNASISKCESFQVSFVTITSLQPAETVTEREKASTVTVTAGASPGNDGTAAPQSTVTVTVTVPAAGDAKAPPASHVVPPHSAPSVIEATPNKDGNGVGVSVISIYSPGLPSTTAHPAPAPSSSLPPPPPPPPAAEVGKKPETTSTALPPPPPPPPSTPPASTSVPTSTTASSSSSTLVESSASAPASTSSSTGTTPDTSAPLESAVQGKPTVIAPTSTTTAAPPVATVPPPPLSIDLSGVTLSSLLDLGNLMVVATAGPDAAAV